MDAGVRPDLPTPDEREFQAWKASRPVPAPATHDDAEFQQWKAQQDKAATLPNGSRAAAGVVPSALDALTFGGSRKLIAAGRSLMSVAGEGLRHPSENLAPKISSLYKQDLSAQEAAAEQYHEQHPYMDTAAQVGGAALNVMGTGGLGVAGDAAAATRLGRFGKAINTGMRYGGLNALGHSDALEQGRGVGGLASDVGKGAAIGAGMGAASIPASAVAGRVLSMTGLPKLAGEAAGGLASALPSGRAQRLAQSVSEALGPSGEASKVIAKRAAMDEAGGFAPNPAHPSLPSLALDRAGPNVESLAEGIANKPGQGSTQIRQTLLNRSAQMRPAITSALEEGTGVKASDRLGPLQKAFDARSAEAKKLYDLARTETKGQPVASETFDQIKATPAGKKALAVAQAQQGNLFHELPTTPAVPDGYSPDQWANVKATMESRGIHVPEVQGTGEAMPDPETLHLMKQHLAQLAKLGTRDGEAGQLSASAKGALSVWGKVRDELPDVWKAADDAYAARSRIIDMMDKGRNVFNTPINPTAPGKKALAKSLGGLDQTLAAASPEEQQAAQVGAATAAHATLQRAPLSVKSPGRVFARSPEQVEQLGHAFPAPEKAQDFQQAVTAWDRAQQQSERITGGSPTARRGAEMTDRDLIPPGNVLGRPRMVIKSLINALDGEYKAGQRQVLDAEIAKILTSPDMQAIPAAQRAGVLRAHLQEQLRLMVAGAGADNRTTPASRRTLPPR